MKKQIKGTVIGVTLVIASIGFTYNFNEIKKYNSEIDAVVHKNDSLTATLDKRESDLALTELEVSELKLALEAEIQEKADLSEQYKQTKDKHRRSEEEVKSLKKTLALLNNELKSKSE
ncbi:hypothetical protein EVJ32_04735 [Exiguobacterium sp. SH5S4]|uniref:hypothetical protein n=1 Tax=Exiguobacterium sp. SH5S4 TaxID=2510961 RepID=UPI00103A6E2D|nr:hypothetical protein [Exiguobacterium sp. SH5S4]TCI26684.1 hypothetical protein EVJ32_04735 [Exiguobacterium sp. SH5S4]